MARSPGHSDGERAKDPLQEVSKMDLEQSTSCTTDLWVDEESLAASPVLKVLRKNDPWSGMDDEEIEDCKEFIRCYLRTEFEVVLQIPVQPVENDFWSSNHEDFAESAFNTYDFQKMQKPFDKYSYRMKKLLEAVRDLAIMHSCISSPERRENVYRRYESLVQAEFREPVLLLVERFGKCADPEQRLKLKKRIARHNRMILKCGEVWDALSPRG